LADGEIDRLKSLDNEWTPLWDIALGTGLRRGELMGLCWNKVDLLPQGTPEELDKGSLQVTQTSHDVRNDEGGYKLGSPKTIKSRRTVKFGHEVAEAFRKVKAEQDAVRERLNQKEEGAAWADLGFVFTRTPSMEAVNEFWESFVAYRKGNGEHAPIPPYGHPQKGSIVTHTFYTQVAKAGLAPACFHDLRDTFATIHLSLNTPTKMVSEMMGHSNTQITQDRYQEATQTIHDSAADSMESYWRKLRSAVKV